MTCLVRCVGCMCACACAYVVCVCVCVCVRTRARACVNFEIPALSGAVACAGPPLPPLSPSSLLFPHSVSVSLPEVSPSLPLSFSLSISLSFPLSPSLSISPSRLFQVDKMLNKQSGLAGICGMKCVPEREGGREGGREGEGELKSEGK